MTQLLPVMLRFLADPYDDTCSTVFPMLQVILSGVSLGTVAFNSHDDIIIAVQTHSKNVVRSN